MNGTEYSTWLSTLTPAQRNAVELAVGVLMDMLLSLDSRVAACEETHRKLEKRLGRVDRYLCLPEPTE